MYTFVWDGETLNEVFILSFFHYVGEIIHSKNKKKGGERITLSYASDRLYNIFWFLVEEDRVTNIWYISPDPTNPMVEEITF